MMPNIQITDQKKIVAGPKSKRMVSGVILLALSLLLAGLVFSETIWAQTEVTANISRYRSHTAGIKSFERYEVKPRAHLPIIKGEIPRKALVTLTSTAERVRIRKYLPDAHVGLRFYDRRTCVNCHPWEAKNFHSMRSGITCSQCHGGEPIAGIAHYYSPMNPRRRYAFVCAKCHTGASASFARYLVHPPNPVFMSTLKRFPALFYVFWGMVVLAVGTFLFFIPHTIAWGVRELLSKKEKSGDELS